jgi:hypothetical protein
MQEHVTENTGSRNAVELDCAREPRSVLREATEVRILLMPNQHRESIIIGEAASIPAGGLFTDVTQRSVLKPSQLAVVFSDA